MSYLDRRARKGEQLPVFRPDASCAKCGHDDVKTIHREGGCTDAECTSCDQEHLQRVCQRCHFDWPEQVLS